MIRVIAFSLIAALAVASSVRAPPIPVFSTGVDSNGNVLPDESADPHYALTVNPQGGNGPYVTNESTYPFVNPSHPNTMWVADTSTSKWISPQASYATFPDDASGPYTYETTFSMTGLNPSTATISGSFAVDDTLVNVYLNGTPLGISGTSQTAFKAFTISSGFVAGLNTLDFDMTNNVQATGNSSGIQINLSGTASVPEPTALFLMPASFLLMGRRRK